VLDGIAIYRNVFANVDKQLCLFYLADQKRDGYVVTIDEEVKKKP
jgi:hypothetical protein